MASVGNPQREICRIAYRLWMEQGQPEGRDREHWETAKEIWRFRNRDAPADGSEAAETQAVSPGSDTGERRKAPRHGSAG